MQFRLRTLFLLFFVIASALGAFGAAALVIVPYLLVLGVIVRMAIVHRAASAALVALALALPGCCMGGLLFLSPSIEGMEQRHLVRTFALRSIGYALFSYSDANGSLPPAWTTDNQGRPMHSWRVRILLYLHGETRSAQYRFTEPWDSPNNSKLALPTPDAFRCWFLRRSEVDDGTTAFLAITGPGTAWPDGESCPRDRIQDPANTVLLVEAANTKTPWMAPKDLTRDEILADREGLAGAFSSRYADADGYFVRQRYVGGHVLMADGSVHFLPGRPSPEDLAELLRIDGPKKVTIDTLALRTDPVTVDRIRWDHVVGLPLFLISFVLLVARPLPKWCSRKAFEGRDSQD
ncbi:MAG: DUF1559 domain-containing protein [Pirellulales bacterium]|nr:DUF1559 domain-containing protein [Pirellulales bacterium]